MTIIQTMYPAIFQPTQDKVLNTEDLHKPQEKLTILTVKKILEELVLKQDL